MSLSSNPDAKQHALKSPSHTNLDTFPMESIFITTEQMQRFELLRLAFFVLKLRKLQDQKALTDKGEDAGLPVREHILHCSLLQHAIFQQILTLTKLDAREQAMQIIATCHKREN
jgi:hypothetical protein